MAPFLLSLTFGLAAYLIYEGLTRPQVPRPHTSGELWARALARLGVHGVPPRDILLVCAASGVGAGLVAWLALGWVALGLVACLLGGAAPLLALARRGALRRRAVQGALVDAIEQVRDAIRAGRSVQEALASLAQTGPEALREDFALLARDMRLDGFEPALARMRDRLAEPAFDTACASLLLNDRLGGRNVGEVLDRLAHATRAQHRAQAEVRAHQMRVVASARVVAAMPVVVLVGIRVVDPGYLAIFDGALGQALLGCCLASMALGYAAMLRVARLPEEPRIHA